MTGMSTRNLLGASLALVVLGGLAAGCGGASSSSAPPATSTTTPATASTQASGASTIPATGALTPEAKATAAGDIPDTQAFLTFRNAAAGYSMQYPEGWAQKSSGTLTTIQNKNNLVRITVAKGATATLASAQADLVKLKAATPSLTFQPPSEVALPSGTIVKVVYSTESAPNPVTGKRVTLVVDRYYVPGTGKLAIVDLGTPQGVDNIDAYRQMIESFQWTK